MYINTVILFFYFIHAFLIICLSTVNKVRLPFNLQCSNADELVTVIKYRLPLELEY